MSFPQYRVVVPLRKGQPELPWVFCKQAAARLWVLPFRAVAPLGVSSEGSQPHAKDSSESVTCLSPKKCFFKNVPSGEVKWRSESLLVGSDPVDIGSALRITGLSHAKHRHCPCRIPSLLLQILN